MTLTSVMSTRAGKFEFMAPATMVVPAGQDVLIPAAIVNRGTTPIALDVYHPAANNYGWGFAARFGEGLNALRATSNGVWNNWDFYTPFIGRQLAPNERFDFTLGEINYDVSFGTTLHPNLCFRIGSELAVMPTTISKTIAGVVMLPPETVPQNLNLYAM